MTTESAPGSVPREDREAPSVDAGEARREVRHESTLNLPAILDHLGASLLISTYQAGKVVVVGAHQGRLTLSFHNFERAMGLAHKPGWLAVGARAQVWFLRDAPDLAPRLPPAGRHDACMLARSCHFTGDVQGHELAWAGDELWLVNTAFSCLCTLGPEHSFVPRWKPPFVSALAAEDRCHLNGLALADGRPRYVTALGESDTPQGWRASKATGGCLLDVPTGRALARGLAMPHSPRVHAGRVWLLDSGRGLLVRVDPDSGQVRAVAELPGYARGLALFGGLAFVGLSKAREAATFGGLPIAERYERPRCGVWVVELQTGRVVARLEFLSGVEEVFAVEVLPGARCPALSGPFPELDGGAPVWTCPPLPD
jgi:uncharacterized protein (TIGR03032 family)